jgi:type IV pilus assembly protein PilA
MNDKRSAPNHHAKGGDNTNMMNKIARKMRGEEEGFTLIELMVVVLIIGILIAIALPTFLGARTRGQDKQAQSSLRNALSAARTCFTDKDSYLPVGGPNCDATQLLTIEAALSFVGAAAPSDGPNKISVNPSSATVLYAAAWSLSGKCFSIKDDVNSGTLYAQPAGVTQLNCFASNATVISGGAGGYGTSW